MIDDRGVQEDDDEDNSGTGSRGLAVPAIKSLLS
jgi:hypothetical protein